MKVYPKIGQRLDNLLLVKNYISEGLEIQMLDEHTNIREFVTLCMQECNKLKEVTIHTVIDYCYIENLLSYKEGIDYVNSLLNDCIHLSDLYRVRVNLLFHCRTRYVLLQRSGITSQLTRIADRLHGTGVHILIENDICILDDKTNLCYAYELVKKLGHNRVSMCLDLCHLSCIASIMKVPRKQVLGFFGGNKLGSTIVHQVHFSSTKNGDGFRDKSTYSQPHTRSELESDLVWLDFLGLTDTILVAELCESDYTKVSNALEELKLLSSYFTW